jgi:hypothetical protein
VILQAGVPELVRSAAARHGYFLSAPSKAPDYL